jgi:MCP family monocarboxylic acid transporter-like MFS transporter 10
MLCLAAIVSGTAFLSFALAIPNPDHEIRVPSNGWFSKRVWVDTQAFRNPAYLWLVASVAILFFGFYAVFFNLEEVCSSPCFLACRSNIMPSGRSPAVLVSKR